MPFINWDQSYSVGVKIIDEQHKKLFALTNALYDGIKNPNQDKSELDNIINDLIAYISFHFRIEEGYFKEFHYEKEQEHIKRHKFYENKINYSHEEYLKSLKEQGTKEKEIVEEILNFLIDWITHHIKIADKAYQQCFNEHGLS